MNARFWIRRNFGWVKVTLRPGQEVEFYHGGACEEGYCHNWQTYRHAGRGVVRESCTRARDCDGYHESHSEDCCPLHMLRSKDPCEDCPENAGILTPQWDEVSSGQRDEFAESMNY